MGALPIVEGKQLGPLLTAKSGKAAVPLFGVGWTGLVREGTSAAEMEEDVDCNLMTTTGDGNDRWLWPADPPDRWLLVLV